MLPSSQEEMELRDNLLKVPEPVVSVRIQLGVCLTPKACSPICYVVLSWCFIVFQKLLVHLQK